MNLNISHIACGNQPSKPAFKGGQLVILQVPSEDMPQAPGHRGEDVDPIPTAPASPTHHQAPSRGLERVGWYIESQKLRKVRCHASNSRDTVYVTALNEWGRGREGRRGQVPPEGDGNSKPVASGTAGQDSGTGPTMNLLLSAVTSSLLWAVCKLDTRFPPCAPLKSASPASSSVFPPKITP